jgi:hypothetical protein
VENGGRAKKSGKNGGVAKKIIGKWRRGKW